MKQTGWEVNYSGRTTYVFETGDTRYSAVNTAVYVGVETGYVINGTKTYCEHPPFWFVEGSRDEYLN